MRTLLATLLTTLLLGSSGLSQRARDDVAPLVVVVNVDNPMTDISPDELAAYFKLELQWWPKPKKKPVTLLLRGTSSDETQVLLEKVYKMTAKELRKHWVGKVFRGEIRRKPQVVVKTADVLARVAKDEGALSVVRADEVTEGVRPLTIGGKHPGDEGYLLDVVPSARRVGGPGGEAAVAPQASRAKREFTGP